MNYKSVWTGCLTLLLASGCVYAQSADSPNGSAAADWSYFSLGSNIGASGILTATNGTRTEIYAGGTPTTPFGDNRYWYALRYQGSNKSFQQLFVSEYFPQGIVRLALARDTARNAPMIVVALRDGGVRLYDQETKELVSAFTGPCTAGFGTAGLAVGDLNGDGTDELIFGCDDRDQTLVVQGNYNYTTWSLPGAGGRVMTVAQMDDDPGMEIASSTGHVVDADTHAVQWQRPAQYEWALQAADFDNDGRAELFVATGGDVTAYDVESQSPKWEIATGSTIGSILVTDIDGDGVQELLIADYNDGSISGYDTSTRAKKWEVKNWPHGVTEMAVANVNGDGAPELLWSSGGGDTGPDHIHVANWKTGKILAQTEHLDGPFIGPQIGDLDGDGVAEMVTASFTSDSGYKNGRIVVLDSKTRQLRAISPPVGGGISLSQIHDLKLRDINGDGRPEIIIATNSSSDGLIEAYSFSSSNQFSLVWTNATRPRGSAFYSVEVADIDGDGNLEILGGVGRLTTASTGVYIYAYDATTRAEEWHTANLFDGYWRPVTDLIIADTDGDGDLDFAGVLEGGDVYVFDGRTHQLSAAIDVDGSSLATRGGSANLKLMIGSTAGRMTLHDFDGAGYPETYHRDFGTSPLNGLHRLSTGSLWVGANGTLRRFSGNTKTFETSNYGEGFGSDLAIPPGQNWVFSAGRYGVHGFKTQP